MLRFRQLGGPYFPFVLFAFNAVALCYLYLSTHSTHVAPWFSKKTTEKQFVDQAPMVQPSNPPDPVTTVFVTPKPKTLTTTKSATVTVTAVSQITATVTQKQVQTQTQTQTVQLPPKQEETGPGFCNVCGPQDHYCHQYGEHSLAKSRTYEGSNARFRRVLRKALAGEPIKIGVLGGSVTKGHGLTDHAHNWTLKLRKQLQELIPMSEIELINGAVPATGSDYYSMCFKEHIPEDVDIVIIELSVNDQRIEPNAVSYEWLLRGLLDLPKKPAILNIQVMALAFETITTGGDLHTPVAEFYDTPVISLRNVLLPHVLKNVPLDEYYFYVYPEGNVDFRHVSVHGHTIMADLLASYTQRQLCAIEREKTRPNKFISKDGKLPNPDELEDIPRLRLFDQYKRNKEVGRLNPSCQSVRTRKNPLVPIETKGWKVWTYEGNNEKPYLMASQPGDYVKFQVQVGVMGRVRITYLRSKTFGLGDAYCWLDDDQAQGTRVVSWWEHEQLNLARVAVITDKATPGKHNLTCEVLTETTDPDGGHQFRLIAVDAA